MANQAANVAMDYQNPAPHEVERLKLCREIDDKEREIATLRRRVADLEDFLKGAAVQFGAMARS